MGKNIHHKSSENKVMILGFVLLAVIGLIFAYVSDNKYLDVALSEASRYQSDKAINVASKVRNFLLSSSQLAKTVQTTIERYEGKDRKYIEASIDTILESAPEGLVYGIGVWYEPYKFEKDNKYFGPYVHRGEERGERVLTYEWTTEEYDFHNQGWYQAGIMGNGKPFFTDPYFDTNLVYMTMALAFYDRDKQVIEGVISVDMVLPQLQMIVDEANLASNDTVYIVGRQGNILAHPSGANIIAQYEKTHPKSKVNSILDVNAKEISSSENSSDYKFLIRECGWSVIVSSPKSDLFKNYYNSRLFIIITCALYLIALIIIYFTIRFFSEKVRRINEAHFKAIEIKNNQISAIVDNVQFGLMRVNEHGEILDGYSQSCHNLLKIDGKKLISHKIWEILTHDERQSEHFQTLFEQVFEQPSFSEETAGMIPKSFEIEGRYIDISYFPILNIDEVESVLCSIEDITEKRLAQIENEKNKALLNIIHNRDHFKKLVSVIFRTHDKLCDLIQTDSPEIDLLEAKRIVHTWKGDLSTYGLVEEAAILHKIEDKIDSTNSHKNEIMELIHLLKHKIQTYLNNHANILKISPENIHDSEIALKRKDIKKLQQSSAEATDFEQLKLIVNEFVNHATMEHGDKILSYLRIAAFEAARKLNKNVHVDVSGRDVRFPEEFKPMLQSLIHIVRNAIDHGIESREGRGAKDQIGMLSIELSENKASWRILVSDDGRGIDADRLKKSLIEKNILTKEMADTLSEDELFRYIFKNSVSTKESVTDMSGRGVGLDSVLANVERLRGRIDVRSSLGSGTSFDIYIPKNSLKKAA